MQLNKFLLLLAGFIQSYRDCKIAEGMLQESMGNNKTDWYSKVNEYYYSLDEKYFEAAGIVQNEWYFRELLHFDISREINKTDYSELDKFHFSDELGYKENIVSSFFFYMWNAWCEQECEIIYGSAYKHFWNKWCGFCENYSVYAATERIYAELDDFNRAKLVERACEVYEGRKRR